MTRAASVEFAKYQGLGNDFILVRCQNCAISSIHCVLSTLWHLHALQLDWGAAISASRMKPLYLTLRSPDGGALCRSTIGIRRSQ